MPKFNVKASPPASNTTNLAGGEAFTESPKLELASLVLTSLVQDQFYRKADQSLNRLHELVQVCDPYFAAQTAIYARRHYGLRSISHALAVELAAHKFPHKRSFFKTVVFRPDDITEILALYEQRNPEKKHANALKRGFADAIQSLSPYQIAKYRAANRGIKLVDAVNITHPQPVGDRNAEALRDLIKGSLSAPDTWETRISQAGKEEDVAESKSAAWQELLTENKLGYMALLKNLRNIFQQSPDAIPAAIEQLIDPNRIHNSKVFPFRYMDAYGQLQKLPGTQVLLPALARAMEISLDNVPQLSGNTVVLVDHSGSMKSYDAWLTAAPFAAALAKKCSADIVLYSADARFYICNPSDSIMSIITGMQNAMSWGGTNLDAALSLLNRPYDRVIILSDMQSWMDRSIGRYNTLHAYQQAHGSTKIFSFDITGYGTTSFPEKNVYALAGFSDKVFDIMGILEQDREALIHTIEQVEF